MRNCVAEKGVEAQEPPHIQQKSRQSSFPLLPEMRRVKLRSLIQYAVRSLQSALRKKYYEIRASLRISRQKAGQFLCGLDLLAERLRFEPSVPFPRGSSYTVVLAAA